jgi:hypothetical protein
VEIDDEVLYVPDDVLEEASSARYQMLPKDQNYVIKKKLEKFTSDRVKDSERKWSERKGNLHPLVTMGTDSLSREVSNKVNFMFECLPLRVGVIEEW